MSFLAHIKKINKEEQNLKDHLLGVACLSAKFASKVSLEGCGYLLGIVHDIGKYSQEFQNYIKSAEGLIDPDEDDYVNYNSQRGKIDHSTAGAQYIYNIISQKGIEGLLAAQVLSLCLASHHSGLIDCITPDGLDNYNRRIAKSDNHTHLEEVLSRIEQEIIQGIGDTVAESKLIDEINNFLKSLRENDDSKETLFFKYGLFTRFLFSCLIDADRLDSANFEFPSSIELRNNGNYIGWRTLIKRLDNRLAKFKIVNEVDKLRNEISAQCFEFYNKSKGIYQLTVPTGGGKTLASLRFALNHANYHQMERIIYVIPYTTIIDQNADDVRKTLEDIDDSGKIVLEHHSNLTPDEESYRQKLLSEDWDAPVVFTTSVQVLEALFGFGTRSARRMHQMANSVIIFDEVQTIPIRCVHMFNVALRFLNKNCGSTVVLCTATQPLLDKVEYNHKFQRALHILPEQRMIPDVERLFKDLKRVDVFDNRKSGGFTENEIKDIIESELEDTGSVLVVVNTKDSAKKIYQEIGVIDIPDKYHLSTNMCPAHRLEVINKIKGCLPDKKPVICVSTQLIEAGVDIDFGTVIRYMAGLDSIAQAAGRCNRNGARPKPGRVLIVNQKFENFQKLKDIKIGIEKAERVFDEYKDNQEFFNDDILSPKAMEQYYKYYFYERSNEMNYPVSKNSPAGHDDNLFRLLSTNAHSIEAYKRINNKYPNMHLLQAFMSASKAFKVIESPSHGVLVPYGEEGRSIINDLCSIEDLGTQYKLFKKAQRYSINVFPHIFNKLTHDGIIYEAQVGSGVYCLDSQYYSNQFGLSEEPISGSDILSV